ncbi:AraC family transcriptional regulator [Achromobacter xylosoxidans]|uniref:AraC family transcriptional regulator n=1 Tax=Alcaligenes xylosoxydans xylosoxydans TaxID=85698 RepID=UPI000CDC3C51|nr:AraC family transcriptional regulator [Achromobacter xylosoxidans]AUZ18349.1 AraC family transcriptional regulator [Achromobacter xylosoxidans]
MTAPQALHDQMTALLDRLAPHEGYTLSRLDGVRFMRANQPLGRTPVLYEPSIVIVCQGSKRGYLADKVYRYDAQHYLVLSVPLPFSTETDATPEEPLLAIQLRLDPTTLADLVLSLDGHDGPAAPGPTGITSTPLDPTLADATLRLLRALASPLEARVLGPGIVRELCFRVLVGEQGGAIRAALASQGNFGRISRALRRIHDDYSQPMEVATLAREAGLSAPAFHAHFKTIAGTSPIQYIKSIRLHQARLLMIRDNLTAAAASTRVGYESASQFNREFKRLFGRSPGEEARQMKAMFALLPAAQLEGVAATH